MSKVPGPLPDYFPPTDPDTRDEVTELRIRVMAAERRLTRVLEELLASKRAYEELDGSEEANLDPQQHGEYLAYSHCVEIAARIAREMR